MLTYSHRFLRVVHSVMSTRILLHVRDIEHKESERTLNTVVSRVVLSFAGLGAD
jgi:hypothetical protein